MEERPKRHRSTPDSNAPPTTGKAKPRRSAGGPPARSPRRKKSEKSLRESEAKFQDLVETIGDWVWEVDREGIFTYASPGVRDLLGYEPEEVLGRTPFDLMPPAESQRVGRLFRSLAASRLPIVALVNVNVHKNGRLVVLETSGAPIFDAGGAFRGYRGVDRDITARKEAEAALEESEERFRGVFELSADPICIADIHGCFRLVNPAFERVLGYAAEELLSKPFMEFIHPEDREKTLRVIEEKLQRGETVISFENRLVRKDGAVVWLEWASRPFTEDRTIAVARDITERKRMEEALRESHEELEERVRERTRELVGLTEALQEEIGQRREAEAAARREQAFRETVEDSLVVGLVAMDTEGKILSVNDAFCAMTGWSKEELFGTGPAYPFWAPEEIKTIYAAARDTSEICCGVDGLVAARDTSGKGSPLAGQEHVLRRRGGERFPALVYASPLRDPDGTLKGYVGSVTDITERKRAEAEYRTILTTAMDGFWLSDHEGRFIDVNDAACRHLGYTREELLGGMRIKDIEAVESPEEVAAHIRKIRDEGHDRFETLHRRRDGTLVDTEVSVNYMDVGGGRFFVFIRDITERKKAEAALRHLHADLERKVRERTTELQETNEQLQEIRRRLRALLDAIPDLVWLKDRESRLIAVNRSYGEACGIDPADLIGKTDLDAWPRALAEKYMADDRRVVESGRMARLEEKTLGRGGGEAWVDTFKVPFFNEGGEVIGTVGIARDISQRKRAEEALQESEAKSRALAGEFRALLDAIPDAVYFKDREGRHRFVNRAFERIIGLSKEAVIGKKADDFSPLEMAGSCRLSDGEVHEKRSATQVEDVMPGPDGARKHFETIKAPIFDEEGNVVGLVGLTRDITRRKRNEAELSAYRGRLKAMVEERTAALTEANAALRETTRTLEELVGASPVGITALDTEGKIILWNLAMEKIFGWAEEEVRGKYPPPLAMGQEGAKEVLERLLAGERFAGVELRRVRKDGRPVDLSLWTAPLREAGGRHKSTVVIFLDITQLREMERIALIQERMAALGQVAAGIAHEIRNPLSGLNLYLHSLEKLLSEAESLDPETRQSAEAIIAVMQGASAKVEGTIKRVLAFSRPGPARKEALNVNACVREAVDMARVSLRKAGAKVAVTLREDLPACLGDRHLIAQVLINLLTNAAEAMEGMEKENRIEVVSGVKDGHVTVSVADSGPGVPPHLQERLFEPFFTTKKEGTGIGLPLSYKIISDHGGFLRVGKSRFGGALFTIGVPAGD
jgi:PAS domain S-box-containing protein